MDDLMDMIMNDGSASDVSDKIKEILYTKSAERIDSVRPSVANSMFNYNQETQEEE